VSNGKSTNVSLSWLCGLHFNITLAEIFTAQRERDFGDTMSIRNGRVGSWAYGWESALYEGGKQL
jgi:hypothetical protein